MPNAEIAEKLSLSTKTVEKYRSDLLHKTGARNTANLVMYCIKNDLIDV
ncbi:MAG: response regulator transcription factor [Bacteroidales bacterium]|nr:response regulator transcription factor [Bacteroidales bacterium]